MPKNIWEIISVKGLLNIVKLVKVFKIKKRDSKKKTNKKRTKITSNAKQIYVF